MLLLEAVDDEAEPSDFLAGELAELPESLDPLDLSEPLSELFSELLPSVDLFAEEPEAPPDDEAFLAALRLSVL